jgi:hypothetical protein
MVELLQQVKLEEWEVLNLVQVASLEEAVSPMDRPHQVE